MKQRVPRRYRHVDEHFVRNNRVTLLRNGPNVYPAMLGAIAAAEQQVLLEMYWFASDATGRRFVDALGAAAERGVEVALIYDSIGCYDADSRQFDELAERGVKVVEYNPILPWRHRFAVSRVSRRDHRKILVVDGDVGFTGGVNIADEWDPEEGVEPWRDDMVRVEGPAVRGFVDLFLRVWKAQGGEPLGRVDPVEDLERAPKSGDQSVRVLGQALIRNVREIVRAYLSHIWQAKRRVWITNSYFVPDKRVVRALKAAARRGVDVRVLLPGEIDVPIVRYASQAMWERLLKAGVRLYELQSTVLHSKTAVIDSEWSTIGTFNLDHLSIYANLEVNLSVYSRQFARSMERSFEQDLEDSREVRLAEFQYRSLGTRLLELLFYQFRGLL